MSKPNLREATRRWLLLPQWIRIFRHADEKRVLFLTVQQADDEFACIAAEMRKDDLPKTFGPGADFPAHAHHIVGAFPSALQAKRAGGAFVRKWLSSGAFEQCSCVGIGAARPMPPAEFNAMVERNTRAAAKKRRRA